MNIVYINYLLLFLSYFFINYYCKWPIVIQSKISQKERSINMKLKL